VEVPAFCAPGGRWGGESGPGGGRCAWGWLLLSHSAIDSRRGTLGHRAGSSLPLVTIYLPGVPDSTLDWRFGLGLCCIGRLVLETKGQTRWVPPA